MNTIDALNHDINHSVNSANGAENDLLRQLIIIDSGAIALVGALVSNHAPGLPVQAMLTVAIAFLATSIITAVVQYLVTKSFFTKLYFGLRRIAETLPSTTTTQEKYRQSEMAKLDPKSNTVSMWMSVICFLAGALVLVAVIVVLIWK